MKNEMIVLLASLNFVMTDKTVFGSTKMYQFEPHVLDTNAGKQVSSAATDF
jgi:hypothetical protein